MFLIFILGILVLIGGIIMGFCMEKTTAGLRRAQLYASFW